VRRISPTFWPSREKRSDQAPEGRPLREKRPSDETVVDSDGLSARDTPRSWNVAAVERPPSRAPTVESKLPLSLVPWPSKPENGCRRAETARRQRERAADREQRAEIGPTVQTS
jgi:hypothetical protein